MTERKWYENLTFDELRAAVEDMEKDKISLVKQITELEHREKINIQIMQSLDRQITILNERHQLVREIVDNLITLPKEITDKTDFLRIQLKHLRTVI
ncbi:MAG: hypothetical protein EHM34_00270 [Nitrosopumilales archaeon]|nr:MAG: hypothetical protein EHM34_00270 [Nitrosopumilales archaeon]